MQPSYLLRAIAFQKGIRESKDAALYACTVTLKQFEESSNGSKQRDTTEHSND